MSVWIVYLPVKFVFHVFVFFFTTCFHLVRFVQHNLFLKPELKAHNLGWGLVKDDSQTSGTSVALARFWCAPQCWHSLSSSATGGAAKDLLFDYLFFGNECTRIEMEVTVCYCKILGFSHWVLHFSLLCHFHLFISCNHLSRWCWLSLQLHLLVSLINWAT